MSPQTRKRARSLLALFLALYAAFTLLPGGVYALYRAQESPPPAQEASPSPAAAQPTATAAPGFLEGRLPAATPAPQEDSFTLYDTATGETFTVTAEEFLPAALACEMDLSAPEEALKAQAVALYTFYSYQRAQHQGEAAHFACDTANWLVYVPQSALEERWGEDFPAYYETLQQAVAAVKGQRLTWEGEPICAAFFAHLRGRHRVLRQRVGAGVPLPPVRGQPRGLLCQRVPLHGDADSPGAPSRRGGRLGGRGGFQPPPGAVVHGHRRHPRGVRDLRHRGGDACAPARSCGRPLACAAPASPWTPAAGSSSLPSRAGATGWA